jgi:hypothetical protein
LRSKPIPEPISPERISAGLVSFFISVLPALPPEAALTGIHGVPLFAPGLFGHTFDKQQSPVFLR